MTTVFGRELKEGDTVETWWQPGRDTITALRPYKGPLAHLWEKDGGARIADFAILQSGMTIEPQMHFVLVAREGG